MVGTFQDLNFGNAPHAMQALKSSVIRGIKTMNNIEQKALALLNEVRKERDYVPVPCLNRDLSDPQEALCRAIEQHEAFRYEVSDKVYAFLNAGFRSPTYNATKHELKNFIIPAPKPDPRVEAMTELGLVPCADNLRAALDARGLEIGEKNDERH